MKRLMLPLIIIGVLFFFNILHTSAETYTVTDDIKCITNLSNKNKRSNLMVRNLSRNFNVKTNLRGLAKRGYCRPTIKNFFIGPKEKYVPTWCGGGTAPPDWFPDEDWKGYPIWPGEEANKPNYNGPYAPNIENGVPFPSEDTPYTTVSGNWGDTLKDTGWTIVDDNSTWNGPNEIIYDGTDEGPGNPGVTITPDEINGDITDVDIIDIEFDGPPNQHIDIKDGDNTTIYENIKYPSGQMINVSESTTLGSVNMYLPVPTTIKSVNYYDTSITPTGPTEMSWDPALTYETLILSNNDRTIYPQVNEYGWQNALGRGEHSSGKLYFEVKLELEPHATHRPTDTDAYFLNVGVAPSYAELNWAGPGRNYASQGWAIDLRYGRKYYSGSYTSLPDAIANRQDVFGVAVDLDAGKIWWSKQGVWLEGDPAAGTGESFSGVIVPAGVRPIGGSYSYDEPAMTISADVEKCVYTPPVGFTYWPYDNSGTVEEPSEGETFTAKSFVLDITNNWTNPDYLGLRSIDFFNDGTKIDLAAGTDFVAYETTYANLSYVAENVFITSLSKIGSISGNGWISASGNSTNQRLICVFSTPIAFDEIKVNNMHSNGSMTDRGAKDIVITISPDEITDTTYNSAISNATQIFVGQLDEHVASDAVDDQTLTLNSTTTTILYNVNYDGNTNDSGTVPTDTTDYEENDVVTVLDNTGNLTKTNYNFLGWNTAVDGSGTTYTSGNTFSITTNTTLYAIWEEEVAAPSDYTAKSVILDIADSHDGPSSYFVGIRSIEFKSAGVVIENISTTNFAAYATTIGGSGTLPRYAFDTSRPKAGSDTNAQWLSSYTNSTNQRLICVFNNSTTFDEIVVNNYHSAGSSTKWGANNVSIKISTDEITDTVYNANISNSTEIFNGTFNEHVASDVVDDQTLVLN